MRFKVFMTVVMAGLVCLCASVGVHAEERFVREMTAYEEEHAAQAAAKWVDTHEGVWYDGHGKEILRIEDGAINGCPVIAVYGIAGGGSQYAATVRISEEQGQRDIKTETVGQKFLYFGNYTLQNTLNPVYYESICGIYLGMSEEELQKLHGNPDSVNRGKRDNGETWVYGKLGVNVGIRNGVVTELRLGMKGAWRLDCTGLNYAKSPGQIYAAYQKMYPSLNKQDLNKFNARVSNNRYFTIQTGPGEYLQWFGKQELIFGAFWYS